MQHLAERGRLIDFTETYQKGITGLERYFELLDADIDIFDREDAQDIDDIEGFVEFKDVSFKYDENDDYILKDINITIPKGKNIAFVGPSGAGKTTLCNLMNRVIQQKGAMRLLSSFPREKGLFTCSFSNISSCSIAQ